MSRIAAAGVERVFVAAQSLHRKPGGVGVGAVEVGWWIGRVCAFVMRGPAVKVTEMVIVWIIIKAAADG